MGARIPILFALIDPGGVLPFAHQTDQLCAACNLQLAG
jgi:hypothetical protein